MEGVKNNLSSENSALKKQRTKGIIIMLLPIAALVLLFVIYLAIILANDYNLAINLETIVNQAIVLVLVATGAIFIFTLGSFDISLGASTLFSATIGIIVYNATGSLFVLFITCIAVAVACSLLNSVLSSVFHLPMFVMTVAMLSVLTSISSTIITTQSTSAGANPSISVSDSGLRDILNGVDTVWFKLIILALFAAVCIFVFNYTKIGRRQKFLGGNPICAKMTGIQLSIYGIIAFVMAGIGAGLGAFGLPGDFSPQSRFVRAAFVRGNAPASLEGEEALGMFFDVLSSVEVPRGACRTENGGFYTRYSCCMDACGGNYYIVTRSRRAPAAATLFAEDAEGEKLLRFSADGRQAILSLNRRDC